MQKNPVIGVTEYTLLFRREVLRFVYETQGIDYRGETSINPLKSPFLSGDTYCALLDFRDQSEQQNRSHLPRDLALNERQGVLWVLLLRRTTVQHSRPFAMRVSMWTTSDSLSSPITALERGRR